MAGDNMSVSANPLTLHVADAIEHAMGGDGSGATQLHKAIDAAADVLVAHDVRDAATYAREFDRAVESTDLSATAKEELLDAALQHLPASLSQVRGNLVDAFFDLQMRKLDATDTEDSPVVAAAMETAQQCRTGGTDFASALSPDVQAALKRTTAMQADETPVASAPANDPADAEYERVMAELDATPDTALPPGVAEAVEQYRTGNSLGSGLPADIQALVAQTLHQRDEAANAPPPTPPPSAAAVLDALTEVAQESRAVAESGVETLREDRAANAARIVDETDSVTALLQAAVEQNKRT